MRATPPWARMSAGTRSRAMTAQAPASSAMRAWEALTTSIITPPLNILARPSLTVKFWGARAGAVEVEGALFCGEVEGGLVGALSGGKAKMEVEVEAEGAAIAEESLDTML